MLLPTSRLVASVTRSHLRKGSRRSGLCVASQAASGMVSTGDAVGVRFNAVSADDRRAVVDSSDGVRGDAYFVVGDESVPQRMAGLHAAVLGLAPHAPRVTKRLSTPFGMPSDDSVITVPPQYVPPGLSVGVQVSMGDGRVGTVRSLNASGCIVDCNHEFAGVDVDISLEVVAHTPASRLQTVVLGMGCFWSPQLKFDRLPGVMATSVGYANGTVPDPDYEAVCTGATGHAEVVQVRFDPDVVSFGAILDYFFDNHDATQVNRQGNDTGTQYRSGIYTATSEQLPVAKAAVAERQARTGMRIASDVESLKHYYVGEVRFSAAPVRGLLRWAC
jgi:peptide-methionine (S)-S-oxide reductase